MPQDPATKVYVHRDGSPSSIAEWMQCPRKWGLVRIDKLIPPDKPSTALGTAVHGRLEDWFKSGAHPASAPPFGEANEIAESGLHLWPAPGAVVFDVEKDINATLDGFSFVGTQDLGYWEAEAAGVESLYVVGDHKTTSDLKWAKTAEDLQSDPQALIYALAAMQRHRVEKVKAQWGYLLTKPGRRKAKASITTLNRPEVEAALREYVLPVAALIRAARAEGAASTDLPQNPNACAAYGGCFFRDKCALTPMDRMRAAMAQETLAAKAKRIKAEQAKAAGDADKVEAIESTEGNAGGPINPPEKAAPGSLVARLQNKSAAAPSGPVSGAEAPPAATTAPTPSAAPSGPVAESIGDKIKRLNREKAEKAAVEAAKVKAPAPETAGVERPKVDTTPKAAGGMAERVSRVEEGNAVKDVPRDTSDDTGGPLPFVLCVNCAPIGDCKSAHGALDLIHREFCEANDVSDFRQLPFNRSGDFAAFFAERFDACRFVGFVFVDPRVEFVRACIPVMERRAHAVIRALAF